MSEQKTTFVDTDIRETLADVKRFLDQLMKSNIDFALDTRVVKLRDKVNKTLKNI